LKVGEQASEVPVFLPSKGIVKKNDRENEAEFGSENERSVRFRNFGFYKFKARIAIFPRVSRSAYTD
jgi:hypothetical protein